MTHTSHEQGTPSFADDEGYAGPALVNTEDADTDGLSVTVDLRGHFEPIDGAFHWYGRVAADAALDQRHRSGDRVRVETPHGSAVGKLTDLDPWGRYRISGTGAPPFAL